VIQQDNAGPHIKADDPDFLDAVEDSGWNINMQFQPPSSPDMNLNDLGFFKSIQSICEEELPRNVPEMIRVVNDAYAQYPAEHLNKIWLSHQQAMAQTLLSRGNYTFKLTHLKKDQLLREGILPKSLAVTMQLYNDCKHYLLYNCYAI
jgi:hypothetical protein